MEDWDLLDELPDDPDGGFDRWLDRLQNADQTGFARFAEDCFRRANTPTLRAAYDVLDGPWARDWGFRGFVASLLLRGEASFDAVLADPERLVDREPPADAQEFVTAILEIGAKLPSASDPDPEAAFPRIEAWRRDWFRPVLLDADLGRAVRRALLADEACDAGRWGRFRVQRQGPVTQVRFTPGPVFRGTGPADDGWGPWFAPMLEGAAEHREFVAPGLGAFRLERHPARRGTHPVTGRPIEIPALWSPRFRASPDLLAAIPHD